MLKKISKMKNKKSFHHFFGKYAVITHITSWFMLIFPYPKFITDKALPFLMILLAILFSTSVITTMLENALEKDPFNFYPTLTYDNTDQLEKLLEHAKAKLKEDID